VSLACIFLSEHPFIWQHQTTPWIEWGYGVSQMPQKLNPVASALEGTCSVQ